ncbi:MAG TPA: LysM domain-containing protein [Methylomusa anaerophila]|uniref:Phage Tail Protein X n=1 Tax=Methylomusa anaerophila TaxID=1930071 RepID=A0A348AJ10_9FIRM|nr:LysM domain-containing protein [Methylomusa anaerophila]BBB91058.1 phage Tail Protein X [Methylomusa anaerophila]HML88933.1 LysM domain-containing protein [Methylomusa anaerophila]
MAKTYTTQQGDTWDIIALRQMGSEKYMSVLIEANQSHNATVIFSAGATLTIPETDIPTVQTLPPWKR